MNTIYQNIMIIIMYDDFANDDFIKRCHDFQSKITNYSKNLCKGIYNDFNYTNPPVRLRCNLCIKNDKQFTYKHSYGRIPFRCWWSDYVLWTSFASTPSNLGVNPLALA